MDAAFRLAAEGSSGRCLGIALEPLTLGHWFSLLRYCPVFVDDESSDSEVNLPLAVFICGQKQSDVERSIKAWWAKPLFWLWGFRCRNLNGEHELDAFMDYLRNGMDGPRASIPIGSARYCSAPHVWRLLSVLTIDYGFTREQAMNMTITEATCLRAAYDEHHGRIELQTKKQRMLLAIMERRRSERKEAMN